MDSHRKGQTEIEDNLLQNDATVTPQSPSLKCINSCTFQSL